MGMEAGPVLDRVAERLKYEVSFFVFGGGSLSVEMTTVDNQWFNVEHSIFKFRHQLISTRTTSQSFLLFHVRVSVSIYEKFLEVIFCASSLSSFFPQQQAMMTSNHRDSRRHCLAAGNHYS